MSNAAANASSVPRLLTAEELAAKTGLSAWRLYELVRAGEIPHVRVGRSVRFIGDDVRAWLTAGGTAGYSEASAPPTPRPTVPA